MSTGIFPNFYPQPATYDVIVSEVFPINPNVLSTSVYNVQHIGDIFRSLLDVSTYELRLIIVKLNITMDNGLRRELTINKLLGYIYPTFRGFSIYVQLLDTKYEYELDTPFQVFQRLE